MKFLDRGLLQSISDKASSCERLRMNYNLHDTLDAPAQRLLNALEPGTVLPVHRHLHTAETYILLSGKIKVLFYDASGKILKEALLTAGGETFGVHIEKGEWHTIEVMKSGSVLFEVKDGPYKPLAVEDILI